MRSESDFEPMPHFISTITKHIGQEFWTNVYYHADANLADAVITAGSIATIEANVHKSTVTFDHILTSEREQPFRNYHRTYLNTPGTLAPTAGELPLPLWNTVRCEFQPTNSGKPDVKQLRLPIYTDEVLDISHITTALQLVIQDNYTLELVALGVIEDDAGNTWVSGITRPEVFDRQLRKRRRKKVHTP